MSRLSHEELSGAGAGRSGRRGIDMREFEGKVALVTGATSGVGRAAALAFARGGARVVVTGRRADEGARVVRLIEAEGGTAAFLPAELTRESEVEALISSAVARFGRLDIAVNNAAVFITGPMIEASVEDYRAMFDANVLGVFLGMKHQIRAMLAQGGGAIVNTSSVSGKHGWVDGGLYVASKHAVEGLTKCAALETARKGIRINAVAPAAIRTEMLERFVGGPETEKSKAMAEGHPIGRVAAPEEIADAILYLASDRASFITGESLNVDGGMLAR